MGALEGQVAIVTGAAQGLGAAFAKRLVAERCHVVITDRRESVGSVATDLGATAHVGDVADAEHVRAVVDATVQEHGTVDILVNNAGLSDSQPAIDESMDDFRYTMDVNLNACFLLSKLVAHPMREQNWGSIINIASVHGFVGSAPNNQAAYSASKAGLVNLTRELALQWTRFGIRVNGIAPGYFETELTEGMIADESGSAWINRNTPMRRPGQLAELEGPLLLLASDAGSYITGQTLVVDGGWTAR